MSIYEDDDYVEPFYPADDIGDFEARERFALLQELAERACKFEPMDYSLPWAPIKPPGG